MSANSKWYELGLVEGSKRVAEKYRKKAGDSFSLGQKTAAATYLEIAEEIESDYKTERANYDKKYPH